MKNIRFLAILPYEGLKEQVVTIAREYPQITIDAFVTRLDDAVATAKKAMTVKNYDIIISRGGTAERLRRDIKEAEIVEIPVGFGDVFKAVMMVRNYTEKIAIQSFPTIAKSAQDLCDILQYDIDVYTIHSPKESREQLLKLQEDGYTMIVGDVTTAAMAQKVGLNATLILSGEDSVREAFNLAVRLENAKDKVRSNWNYLDSIQREISVYIAGYNEDGQKVFTNDSDGVRFPKLSAYIDDYMKSHIGEEELTTHCELDKMIYTVYLEKIRIGEDETITAVFGRRVATTETEEPADEMDDSEYVFRSQFGVANSVGETRETILSYCNLKDPVLILGEAGCGKDQVAASLHRLGKYKNTPYCVMDFALLTEKEWSQNFRQSSSPLLEVGCTIYLKNIQKMKQNYESMMIDLIENSNLCRRNKIILSAVVETGEDMCPMARYMMERTSCVLLQAMPLRKRKEDILNLCTLYLNAHNTRNGTQLLGLKENASAIVEAYSWPGNISQLKRVLKEAALMTEGDFITADTIERCIYNEEFDAQRIQTGQINLKQSLEGITYDLVRMVLREENMNRRRTADRLKISRTTLWRILRSKETLKK